MNQFERKPQNNYYNDHYDNYYLIWQWHAKSFMDIIVSLPYLPLYPYLSFLLFNKIFILYWIIVN